MLPDGEAEAQKGESAWFGNAVSSVCETGDVEEEPSVHRCSSRIRKILLKAVGRNKKVARANLLPVHHIAGEDSSARNGASCSDVVRDCPTRL